MILNETSICARDILYGNQVVGSRTRSRSVTGWETDDR